MGNQVLAVTLFDHAQVMAGQHHERVLARQWRGTKIDAVSFFPKILPLN